MIPVKQNITLEGSGVIETVKFHADQANFGVIFNILRSQLYSDPELAVLREYSTNAVDAHVMSGQKDKPIRVILPTTLDCNLRIRDFGTGLDDAGIKDTFCSYAASTKRNTQDATGMLGIGCKSGFAYNDSFIVNSYQNGKMTTWNAYIDPTNMGDMAKLGCFDSTEPDGLEIVIPVKDKDIAKFQERSVYLFKHFSVMPEILNLTPERLAVINEYRSRKCMFNGTDWNFYGDKKESFAVMGNIPYPLNAAVFSANELTPELAGILEGGVHIYFKIGDLEFAASREALQYTAHTKKAIIDALTKIGTELVNNVKTQFASCTTLWDAKCMYAEVFTLESGLYPLRHLFASAVQFNGQPIGSNEFHIAHGDRVIVQRYAKTGRYSYNIGSSKVVGEQAYRIIASKKSLVVRNDKGLSSGLMNRIVPQIEGYNKYQQVYIISFYGNENETPAPATIITDKEAEDAYKKRSGFDGEIVDISTLPKEPLSKYYPNLSSRGGSNPKHSAKEFFYSPNANLSRRSKNSDFWNVEVLDVANDAGVYVNIEEFLVEGPLKGDMNRPRHLDEYIMHMKNFGIIVPKIYGFKKKSQEVAKTNPKMVLLWDYIKAQFFAVLKTLPTVEQDMVDRRGIFTDLPTSEIERMMSLGFKGNSPLTAFLDVYNAAKGATPKQTNLLSSFEWLANYSGHKITATPKINLKSRFNLVKHRYPLLTYMVQNCQYHIEGAKKPLIEYVELMDAVTP